MGLHWSYDMAKRHPIPQQEQVPTPWRVSWVWVDTGHKDTLSFATKEEAEAEAVKINEVNIPNIAIVEYKEPYKRK